MERTFVLIKPDGVQRGLSGEIIKRLEQRGLKLIACKFLSVSQELAEKHYAAHVGKPFYAGLIKYISSAPVMAMIWEGPEAIAAVRQTMGATDPVKADPGSIRHDYGILISRNLTHASDSVESASFEINLWFTPEEIFPWDRCSDPWLLGKN
ncbi:MAG: nucleoside-diphosphate kinase [Anaerolineaceae bacterium]|nr:nucleoside-diphosphate kinase [Anaerolineaceae bacterium]